VPPRDPTRSRPNPTREEVAEPASVEPAAQASPAGSARADDVFPATFPWWDAPQPGVAMPVTVPPGVGIDRGGAARSARMDPTEQVSGGEGTPVLGSSTSHWQHPDLFPPSCTDDAAGIGG